MSQLGHGFALPEDYNLHQDMANLAQQSHVTHAFHPDSFSQGTSSGQQNGTSNYGHSKIPGLGLGLSNNSAPIHGPGPGDYSTSWQQYAKGSGFVARTDSVPQKQCASVKIPGLQGARDIASEDGEVSEDGELEDVYEPAESTVARQGQQANPAISSETARGSQKPVSERDGSYSPYLSPHELVQSVKDMPKPVTGKRAAEQLSPIIGEQNEPSHSLLQDVRRQAKDAILRLWPFDIRFQNYIVEGIDEGLLKSLFMDMGLDIMETTQAHPDGKMDDCQTEAEETEPKATEADTKNPENSKPAESNTAEERKDRIARLLAAKGSKQSLSTSVALPAPVSSQSHATKSIKSSMRQSEKSKLIAQKLAALKRAREIPQEQKPSQPENSDSGQNGATSSDANRATTEEPMLIAEVGHSSLIPGLSLSPGQKSMQTHQAGFQPSATPKTTSSHEASSSAQFDQNPESRPFLIHVSDDDEDEDEEMEIDSPGCPETPPNGLRTPTRQDNLSQNSIGPVDLAMASHMRSPASISTPLRSTSRNNGGDLESMNKQIEEMKRKIAEAEARKKAKASRPGSPTPSQRQSSSLDDSSDVASHPSVPAKAFYGDLNQDPKSSSSPSLKRHSRSRAASERLPLFEARRREQLEKLRILQSEVARIELELEEDKLEEERLKIEIMDCGSDKEEALLPMLAAVPAAAETIQSPGVSDKMDVVEESPLAITAEDAKTAALDDVQCPGTRNESSAVDVPAPENGPTVETNEGDIDPAVVSINNSTSYTHSESANSDAPLCKVDGSQVDDGDVAMEDTGYSADEDVEGDSADDYEPPGVARSPPAPHDESKRHGEVSSVDQETASGADQVISRISSPSARDSDPTRTTNYNSFASSDTSTTSFVPYETPLQYFHAYRFHPSFNQSVAGGLRSLTYSNKIDVRKELCPVELTGESCPRGNQCDYQHFETMQAPDDQILLQLGASEHYDEEQRQRYIGGLKQLLTDYRNRKVKDFNTISQGIIDYRAQFLGDKTKILPLGHVTI